MNLKDEVPERLSLTVCKIAGPMKAAPILMWITPDEVGLRMGLNRFVDALASEIGNPALILTQAQLQAKLQAAADRIVLNMKLATTGA